MFKERLWETFLILAITFWSSFVFIGLLFLKSELSPGPCMELCQGISMQGSLLEALSFTSSLGTGEFSLVSEKNSILVEHWVDWEPKTKDSRWAGCLHICLSTVIMNHELVGLEPESFPSTSLRHSRTPLLLPTSYHGLCACSFLTG